LPGTSLSRTRSRQRIYAFIAPPPLERSRSPGSRRSRSRTKPPNG
jgi:hypothetical protein